MIPPIQTRADVVFNENGLVPAVVQDASDGTVLMVAWMNAEALELTLRGPNATFWSRSRQRLWTKGEVSGNLQEVVTVATDCDRDVVLLTVRPAGPACHTGERSCFFEGLTPEPAPPRLSTVLRALTQVIEARRNAPPDTSYTAQLLAGGPALLGAKVREEAEELAVALAEETGERVTAEAADLVYHMLVGLVDRGVSLNDVAEELDRRRGRSGVEEKAARSAPTDS